MLKPMRMQKRQTSNESATKALSEGTYGVLSTISEDKTPYSTPLNYVYYDNAIYFHCANEGHKLDNIKQNSAVCFLVVVKATVNASKFTTNYESVIVNGRAQILDKSENTVPLMKIISKYSSDFMDKAQSEIDKYCDKTTVVRVNIESIAGKSNII